MIGHNYNNFWVTLQTCAMSWQGSCKTTPSTLSQNEWMWQVSSYFALDEDIFPGWQLTDWQAISFGVGGWWCRGVSSVMGFPWSWSAPLPFSQVRERWKRLSAFIAPSWSTQYWITILGACSLLTLSTVSPAPGLYLASVWCCVLTAAVMIRPYSLNEAWNLPRIVFKSPLKQNISCACTWKFLLRNSD